jgi:hypothetical protein
MAHRHLVQFGGQDMRLQRCPKGDYWERRHVARFKLDRLLRAAMVWVESGLSEIPRDGSCHSGTEHAQTGRSNALPDAPSRRQAAWQRWRSFSLSGFEPVTCHPLIYLGEVPRTTCLGN